MSLKLTTFLTQMPSVRTLLDLILDDLRHGRSVLGLFPEGINTTSIRSALFDGLGHWHLNIQEILLSQLDIQTPAAALGHALGVDWGASTTPRTVENLLRVAEFPEILFLDGFEELAEEDRDHWLQLMVQWAQIVQGRYSTDEDGVEILPVTLFASPCISLVPSPTSRNKCTAVYPSSGGAYLRHWRCDCCVASLQNRIVVP